MEEERMLPYYVHEGEMARQERHNKRLWLLCILLFLALIASNAGWLWYNQSAETYCVEETELE